MRGGSHAVADVKIVATSELYVVLLDTEGMIIQVSSPPASAARRAEDGCRWIGRHLYEVFVPYTKCRPESAVRKAPAIYTGSYTAAGMLGCEATAYAVRTVALPNGAEPLARYVAYLRPLWAPKAEENHAMDSHEKADMQDYAIHRVAGGLAHDINNALFVVIGLAEEMLDDLAVSQGAPGDTIRTIITKARLVGTKSHQILRLMEVPRPAAAVQALQPILEHIVSASAHTWPEDVHVQTQFTAPTALVQFHQEDLAQILQQCFENAIAAMPAGGTVEIGLQLADDREGGPLQLWVADSGCGMTEAVLAQSQEPFYSTWGKPGLGLPIVKALARAMRAVLTIRSTPETGTRVQLEIPVQESVRDAVPAG